MCISKFRLELQDDDDLFTPRYLLVLRLAISLSTLTGVFKAAPILENPCTASDNLRVGVDNGELQGQRSVGSLRQHFFSLSSEQACPADGVRGGPYIRQIR